MARVKRSVNAKKKRREVLDSAKGYRGQRSRLYRKAKEQMLMPSLVGSEMCIRDSKAKEQMLHSKTYEFRDRRHRKGQFRKLWIQRINAAARANGMTYNRFIQGLALAGVEVDRKNLAELAVNDAATFAALVETAKAALPDDVNAPAAQ